MSAILHADPCPDCGGGGGGGGGACGAGEECLPSDFIDPDDCPACDCSGTYIPYCLGPENADDPETVILATSPFTYYRMDGAGALDIVGGNNGISSIGTVTYGVASLSSKLPALSATRYTAGGSIAFPPPQAGLTTPGLPWAVAMLLQIDAYDAGVGGSGPFSFISWSGSSPPKMGHFIESPGRLTLWNDSTFADLGTMTQSRPDPLFPIGEPHCLILNMYQGAGTGVNQQVIEAWIDGVLVVTSSSDNSGIDGGTFSIGRLPGGGPFFGAVDMTYGPLALWNRALTVAEIQAISAALIDDAILATAWVPS